MSEKLAPWTFMRRKREVQYEHFAPRDIKYSANVDPTET